MSSVGVITEVEGEKSQSCGSKGGSGSEPQAEQGWGSRQSLFGVVSDCVPLCFALKLKRGDGI